MPIRREWRHFYRGQAWAEARARILARAGNRCEECKKPNDTDVYVVTDVSNPTPRRLERVKRLQCWLECDTGRVWRDSDGKKRPRLEVTESARKIHVKLHVAHLNHTPGDDRDENLRALCQWCHLNYDRLHHHETRATRKDARRPIIVRVLEPKAVWSV